MDWNVPESQYGLCQDSWRGDSYCDDMCRTEECDWDDGDDCESSCDGNCAKAYLIWSTGTTDGQNKLNITLFCRDWWSTVLLIVDDLPSRIQSNCTGYVNSRDYNGDGFLNFREAVA